MFDDCAYLSESIIMVNVLLMLMFLNKQKDEVLPIPLVGDVINPKVIAQLTVINGMK